MPVLGNPPDCLRAMPELGNPPDCLRAMPVLGNPPDCLRADMVGATGIEPVTPPV